MGTSCRTINEVVVDGADAVGVIPCRNIGKDMVDGARIGGETRCQNGGKGIVAKIIVEAPSSKGPELMVKPLLKMLVESIFLLGSWPYGESLGPWSVSSG
jgi:hypothetical protein